MSEDERIVRRRVRVSGSVQGVFFRQHTLTLAEHQGVSGWVRNLPDGTVEAVFEGTAGSVARMVEACRVGPPEAAVERLEATREDPEGLSGFAIR
jgi:acylphosphatase